MKNILLVSKEVLRKDFLSCYNSTAATPNIDQYSKKGTVFTSYYTAAPSTAMAVSCMFSGLNAYELGRKTYEEVEMFRGSTLFSQLGDRGYKTHVVWSDASLVMTYKYSKVFSPTTAFHFVPTWPTDLLASETNECDGSLKNLKIESYLEILWKIFSSSEDPVFVWMHCPHVFSPKTAIGTDMDLFDQMIGEIVNRFEGSLFITADHGTLLGEKGVFGYGYHLYEPSVNIPLITPFMRQHVVTEPVSSIQLSKIIIEETYTATDFIYSDTAYYEQPNRKMMIRSGKFKYIYNKLDNSEELYDIDSDPYETLNLAKDLYWESHRKRFFQLKNVHPYSDWDTAKLYLMMFRYEKNRIWRKGGYFLEVYMKVRYLIIKWLPPAIALSLLRLKEKLGGLKQSHTPLVSTKKGH
jgi:hypothetical protein